MIATRHRTIDRATASWWGNLALLALLAILLALPFHSHRLLAQGQTSTDEPVVVILRFGDGSERHYTQIRWTDGLTALDALQRAADHPRGFPLQVRGKGKTAFVVSIDGLSNEGDSGKNWIFRVNGTVGEQSAGVVSVSAGGRVEWNFETPP